MLRHRTFRLYFVGQVLSTFGDSLVPLTIAFAALQVGGAGALGLVLAANRLPIAMLVLFGGAFGDRWNRRLVMVGADVLRCATQATSGLLLVLGQAGLWHLVVLQALAGAGTAVFTPAAAGLVPELVPRRGLQRANALIGLATNTNKVVSISAAGLLVATAGPGVALLVDAATFAASAGSLLMLRLPAGARETGRTSLWSDIRAGARLVAGTPWLRTLLGYSALLQAVVIGPHMVAGPLLAAEVFGGAGAWATIGVVQALGSIAGGMVALRWQPRRPLISAVAVSLLMVPYLLLFAAEAPLWLVALAAVAVGGQGAFFLAVQSTTLQQHVPEMARSRVGAWSQLGNLILLPASLAVTGPVAAAVGSQAVLLADAGWLVVSTLAVLTSPALRWLGQEKASLTGPAREASAT
jgi:MFS family permease